MRPLAGTPVSLGEAVRAGAGLLAEAGVASPRHDAEELAAYVLGTERGQLWSHPTLTGEEAASYAHLIARRSAREPLQHITGRAYFRHVELAVGPGVFVPRPETELVAGAALDAAREAARARGQAPVVVDLCTGSGAIALAIATELVPESGPESVPESGPESGPERAESQVHAVELSGEALAWAARNLAGTGVVLHAGDIADALPELDGGVDVVVANPPYVPLDGAPLEPEVRDHDPAPALWAGASGLEAIVVVEQVAARLLRDGGVVVVEHADVQGESAPAVFSASGRWDDVADHRDLAGRPRFLSARRRLR